MTPQQQQQHLAAVREEVAVQLLIDIMERLSSSSQTPGAAASSSSSATATSAAATAAPAPAPYDRSASMSGAGTQPLPSSGSVTNNPPLPGGLATSSSYSSAAAAQPASSAAPTGSTGGSGWPPNPPGGAGPSASASGAAPANLWLRCPSPPRTFLLELLESILLHRSEAFHKLPQLTVALRQKVRLRKGFVGRNEGRRSEGR